MATVNDETRHRYTGDGSSLHRNGYQGPLAPAWIVLAEPKTQEDP